MSANHGLMAAALCMAAGLAVAQETPRCSDKPAEKGLSRVVEVAPVARRAQAQEKPCCSEQGAQRALTSTVTLAPVVMPAQAQSEVDAGRMALDVMLQPEARGHSRTIMVHSENGREFKVELNGDRVKAWIDGDRVPQDRVKVSPKKIVLLGEDGERVHEFERAVVVRGAAGGHAPHREVVVEAVESPIVWGSGGYGVQPLTRAQPGGEHPPVMIGINMGSLDEGEADEEALDLLLEHDLGAGDAVVVMGVIDGLPAEEAGLREGDVLVRIDGEWGVTPESLRELLMEKEPGDTIELLIVRDGEREEIEIELAPYDTQRLGPGIAPAAPGEPSPFTFRWSPQNEEVQELLERLEQHRGDLDEEIQELVERLQEENFERFQLDALPRFRVYPGGDNAPRALVTPAPPSPPRAPFAAEHLREHEERLERIEERLEGIEDRLDRLLEVLGEREGG